VRKIKFRQIIICALMTGILLPSNALASIEQAPAPIKLPEGKAVFVDFTQIKDLLTFDLQRHLGMYKSRIEFTMPEEGMPIFDLVKDPIAVSVNGKFVQQKLVKTPDKATFFRIAQINLQPGRHTLEIIGALHNVDMSSAGIGWIWTMDDLIDRGYMERYLPANLEFDQAPRTVHFRFLGDGQKIRQNILTNGLVKQIDSNNWQIQFSEKYTASSFYLHFYVKGRFEEHLDTYRSIDGRQIPLIVYGDSSLILSSFMTVVKETLPDLEKNFGPWQHNQVIVYAQDENQGGMEYCGATITSKRALAHELTHSYFARGIMPANGNSGWVDESITTWIEKGMGSSKKTSSVTGMAAHSAYSRFTDRKAYSDGVNFIRYLDYQFAPRGGMLAFLKYFVSKRMFQTITTQDFKNDLENFSGRDLTAEFQSAVYNQGQLLSFAGYGEPRFKMGSDEHQRRIQ
jgi:hypothetical protein